MSDGFNNPVVGGGGALVYPSIHSPNYETGVQGWSINKSGSAEFSGLTLRGTFYGTDFILTASGFFLYSGPPALGNLIASNVPGVSTVIDPEGNTAQPGIATYSSNGLIAQLFTGGLQIGSAAQIEFSGGDEPGGISPIVFGSGAGVSVNSGSVGVSDTETAIQLLSALASSITNGQINLAAGEVAFGQAGNCNWNDNSQSMSLPAAGGPYVSGESWHAIMLPSGYSGTMRVKLLPWQAVFLDVNLTAWPTTAGASSGGSLPSAAYYPTSTRVFPMTLNGTPSGIATNLPRVYVPASGAVQLIVPANTNGSPAVGGCSVVYPNN